MATENTLSMLEGTCATNMQFQIDLLVSGKPLAAFDKFFGRHGLMFANDTLFASGAQEARAKQEPFINSATSIEGKIVDFIIDDEKSLCAFRNLTSFTNKEGAAHQINGLVWQQWKNGTIEEERYYDGKLMKQRIAEGILKAPSLLYEILL